MLMISLSTCRPLTKALNVKKCTMEFQEFTDTKVLKIILHVKTRLSLEKVVVRKLCVVMLAERSVL